MRLISSAWTRIAASAAVAGWLGLPHSGWAADPVQLTIKGHRFTPDQVIVPAGERLRIEVTNQDPTPAEFESSDLRAEKIVIPGGKVTVTVGPLRPGKYLFFDDYHPDEAKGSLEAVERQAKE